MLVNATNRGIKTKRTIKTKLPLQFCINGLTIIIGPLRLVQLTKRKTGRKHVNKLISRLISACQLTNRKTGRKHVNKLISRQSLIFLLTNGRVIRFVYMLSSRLPIGQLTSVNSRKIIVRPFIQNQRGNLVLMVFYVFLYYDTNIHVFHKLINDLKQNKGQIK